MDKKNKKALKQRREVFVGLAFTVVGAAVAFEQVYIACLFWAVALFYSLQFIGHFHVLHKKPALRIAINAIVLLAVIGFGWGPIAAKRHEQKAAQTSGYIHAVRANNAQIFPVLQWGNSGYAIEWNPLTIGTPDAKFIMFRDAGIFLDMGEDGMEISTIIRDRSGHEVVAIEKNHWVVIPQNSVDHNYTDDTLEVLDAGGHPVLQVQILEDRIRLRGEWHDEFGHATQLTECAKEVDPRGGCVSMFGPSLPEQEKKITIERLFKYPSKEHWAEWR